jgi:invasion protein IalB
MTGLPRIVLGGIVAVLIFAVGVAVGWVGNGSARPDVPTISIYDGWRLSCPPASQNDKPCAISNDLVDTKTHDRVAELAMLHTKKGTVLVVTAPFNVLLPEGLGLVLGKDKPRVYSFQACNTVGCIAEIKVDDALRNELRQTAQGKLLFGNLDRKTVAIEFSLQGFEQADKAFEAHRHRHSFLGMAI